MKLHEASMPEELGKMGTEVEKAGIKRMAEERVKKMEKRRQVEFSKGVLPGRGEPGSVLNFVGKYAG